MTTGSNKKKMIRDIMRRTGWPYTQVLPMVEHVGYEEVSNALDDAPEATWGAVKLVLAEKARKAQKAKLQREKEMNDPAVVHLANSIREAEDERILAEVTKEARLRGTGQGVAPSPGTASAKPPVSGSEVATEPRKGRR
jgi:hypothetical protein